MNRKKNGEHARRQEELKHSEKAIVVAAVRKALRSLQLTEKLVLANVKAKHCL